MLAAGLVALCLPVAAPSLGTPELPNIVYVMADDLGYGELGCYGQTKIRTPNVDALSREGVRFTRFYSASPVCAPTRASLMVGKHTGHSPIRGNKELGGWGPDDPEGQWPLPLSETTLPEALRAKGYATGIFGKWGLGGPDPAGHPLSHGFDRFFGYICQRQAHGFYPSHLWTDHNVRILRGNPPIAPHQKLAEAPSDPAAYEQYRGKDYSPALILEEALAFVETHRDRPFFLYFASTLPHAALQAPREWVDRYPMEWDPTPYLGDKSYLPCLRPRATYAAMISYLDFSVGELRDRLRKLGIADRTLFVFTSDNGATFNGGVDREFFASNGALRGTKATLWEGGVRVPFVAAWPGQIPAGRSVALPASSYDVFATVADLVGIPRRTDGTSFADALRGRASRPRPPLYFEYPENPSQAVIAGKWKAIRPYLGKNDRTVELYDLESDPGETRDVATQNPAVVARLTRRMATMRRPNPVFPLPGLDEPAKPR